MRNGLLLACTSCLPLLCNAQLSQGQSFPGGVIVSLNPGASTAPPIPTLTPRQSPPAEDEDEEVGEGGDEEEGELARLRRAIEALCSGPPDRDAWEAANMPQFTKNLAAIYEDEKPDVGWLQFLVNRVDSVAATSYTCGGDNFCELGTLDDRCEDDPQTISVLRSLANLANGIQALRTMINEESDFFDGQAARIPQMFNPIELDVNNDDFDALSNGLAVVNMFVSLVPQLAAVSGGLDFIESLIPFFEREEPEDNRFDQFADIAASAGAVTRATLLTLRDTIRGTLDTTSPVESVADFISEGGFARPLGDVSEVTRDRFLASLAAPAISRLWGEAGVVVIAASERSLGFDPCDGDKLFKESDKMCQRGKMTVLRSVGTESNHAGLTLEQGDLWNVPGLNDLDLFNILPEEVMVASSRIQGLTQKYYGVPDKQETLDSIIDVNRIGLDGGADALMFNLPFCDLDVAQLPDNRDRTCEGRFEAGSKRDMCEFNLRMLCACPGIVLGGNKFPFDFRDTVNCNIEQPA